MYIVHGQVFIINLKYIYIITISWRAKYNPRSQMFTLTSSWLGDIMRTIHSNGKGIEIYE